MDVGGGARLAWPGRDWPGWGSVLGFGVGAGEVTAGRGHAWDSHTGESSMQRGDE
jgi:hypothetical protein